MPMWPNDKLNNAINRDDIAGEVRRRGVQRKQTRRVIRPASKLRTGRPTRQRRGGVRK